MPAFSGTRDSLSTILRCIVPLLLFALPLTGCDSGSNDSSQSASSRVTGAATGSSRIVTGPATTNSGASTTLTSPAKGATATSDPAPSTPVSADPTVISRSISSWVSCDGVSDDTAGLTRAFAAASHGAFTLIVDCPVRIKIGMDIARTIFIDDGTTVEFTAAGKLTVDNVFIPAFVIANSNNITLSNWNVEYDASLPVNPNVGGYVQNGQLVRSESSQPANAFTDLRLTQWLTANRAITFEGHQDNVSADWSGPTNACAVFFLTGDTSNVTVTGMQIYAPATVGGNKYIPVVFSMSSNYKSSQTVTLKTPKTAQYVEVPHALTFSNISLDGIYMGWVGGTQNTVFDNIQSHRYADLQDANGENVGGIGKWFAPPHLFYLSYSVAGDPALFNKNIRISNVVDEGVRTGKARDAGSGDTLSGNALSLKIGCVNCSVDNYKSSRPDGFLDVLSSDGLTISNVTASYDSSFLNNLYPGWRFPQAPYTNVSFQNVTLTDLAQSTVHLPIDNAYQTSNQDIKIQNVQVGINQWTGSANLPLPTISGTHNAVSLNYSINARALRVARTQSGTSQLTLQATPAAPHVGTSTQLTWTSSGAGQCAASGAWSGAVASYGSVMVKMKAAGNYNFIIACRDGSASTSTTLLVVVSR